MKRIVVIVIIILVAAIGGGLWWYHGLAGTLPAASGIFASGFIEATDVSIASEISGRIVSISTDEGSEVKADVILVKLDDSLQKAQLKQAEAAVKLAQSGLEQAMAARNQAMAYSAGAKKAWEDALDVQKNPLELDSRIAAAQSQLDNAEVALSYAKEINPFLGALKSLFWTHAFAQQQRDGAQTALQTLLSIKSNPQDINARVDQTYAAYQTAQAAVEVAEKAIGVATRQLEQARASLEVIQVQLAKTVLTSPLSGTVTARNAEVGELSQPGIPILTITELGEVTLIAYVPESKLGLVKLGQEAIVSVDSYPGQDFSGKITYISPRAQFTPRNIQMKEEREKTVFAVKIRLPNPEHKLKPGMPADARILAH